MDFESPDLELKLISVIGTVNPVSTDWACRFECREPGGCRADVEVLINYRSQRQKRTLKIVGRLNEGEGEALWLARAQRPPEIVDRVDRVVVEVVAPFDPSAPLPTPVQ